MMKKSVRYTVLQDANNKNTLEALSREFDFLNDNEATETSFIILPYRFTNFNDYLDLTEKAERFTYKESYEGIYQVASFHPQYLFAGAPENDAANYTNRSPYPMLHILREDSITKALEHFKNPGSIPDNNIDFAREKGLAFMQQLLASCIR